MPRKSSSGIGIFTVSHLRQPASAFRHKDQSGTADSGLVRHCPAIYLLHTVLMYTYVYVYYTAQKILLPGINTVIDIKHAWSEWSPTHQPDLFLVPIDHLRRGPCIVTAKFKHSAYVRLQVSENILRWGEVPIRVPILGSGFFLVYLRYIYRIQNA